MIHVDIGNLIRPTGWDKRASDLLDALKKKSPTDRSAFIDQCSDLTWADPALLTALRSLAGNKCWYSEVPLEGADPNVDHFRPKGRVKEVDSDLKPNGTLLPGYWWWAFEWRNFRLASMHSNQRRVDSLTAGGKADFFPVKGARAAEESDYTLCVEDVVPIDPCKQTDVALLWFDSDGAPSCSAWQRNKSDEDEWRVKVSIWLYHLDKQEIVARRREHMDDIRADLITANTYYCLWKDNDGGVIAKNSFENKLTEIRKKVSDKSLYAGAKRAAIRSASGDYKWIFEFGLA